MPKQILLIDDSVTVKRMVEITFAREDTQLTAAKSGDEGVQRAKELRPDLVLVDAGLPGKSGYDVCAELRAAGVQSPVLILAGNFSPYDEGRGAKAGADGAVVKPFETQALIDKAADAIAKKRGGAGQSAGAAPSPGAAPSASAPAPVGASSPTGPRPSTLSGIGPAPVPAPVKAPAPAPPPSPSPSAGPPRATLMGIPAVHPSNIPGGATRPSMPPTWAPPAPAPAANVHPAPVKVEAPAPAKAAPSPSPISPPPRQGTMAMPTVAMPTPAHAPVATPAAAPLPAPAPAPRMAAPVPAAPVAHPEAGRAVMPANVPTMPRASLIPNTPTPKPNVHSEPAPVMRTVPSMPPSSAVPASADQDAVSRLSRELVERIAWEVVPELAEAIIKEHLDRLVKQRQG